LTETARTNLVVLDGEEDKALARLPEEWLFCVRLDGKVADIFAWHVVERGDMLLVGDGLVASLRLVRRVNLGVEEFSGRVEVDGRESSGSSLGWGLSRDRHFYSMRWKGCKGKRRGG
jgi:hypothetical protein